MERFTRIREKIVQAAVQKHKLCKRLFPDLSDPATGSEEESTPPG